MTATGARQNVLRIILDAIRDAGWKNIDNTALAITEAIFSSPDALDNEITLLAIIPENFLVSNHTNVSEVYAVLASKRDTMMQLAASQDPLLARALISMSDIDSFSNAKNISATVVSSYSNPLRISEDQVEQIIAAILGEPYRQKDWAGEHDDLFSAQVRLADRNVTASFMLKGPGLRGTMKPKNLGSNGDQITRMMSQPAELYVVQFVGRIDSAVYQQLKDAVIAKRVQGEPHVVGSVWNGVDTARLGVAYGFLDATTGQLDDGRLASGSPTV